MSGSTANRAAAACVLYERDGMGWDGMVALVLGALLAVMCLPA
jgi:hypothetical protein